MKARTLSKLYLLTKNNVFLFSLNDEQIHQLAEYAMIIESHYERPMDIEWALDGVDDKLYIVQARPETVKSRLSNSRQIEKFHLKEPLQ